MKKKKTYLRKYIQNRGAGAFAIVELPSETFSPYVTIHTSILFIQKGKHQTKNENKIFISINNFCGHDKKGRSVDKDDIPKVSKFYHSNLAQGPTKAPRRGKCFIEARPSLVIDFTKI
uniref:DNA methylase adenine-specific domain-containing protein n=1 Tax=Caulerpa cliftonii TaxID=1004391 RepID=A0A1C9JBS5_9CHLO|nr:hypothetical protein [Caulerpa cliftonii]AOP19298.1 hypothetical protein [Caulerpa cliftonii]